MIKTHLWLAPTLIFCGLFTLISSHALAQSADIDDATRARIETVLKQESCLDYAQIALSEWNRILDRFTVDPTSERHLLTRFGGVKDLHSQALVTLTSFAKAPLPQGLTPSEFSTALETLKTNYSDINEQMNASRAADEKFLQLAMEAERSFVDMSDIFLKSPETCDAKTITTLKAHGSAADERRKEVTIARKYVADAAIKREKMLYLSYEIRRNALLSAHAKATKQSLIAIKTQLGGILALGDLQPEFIRWRFSRSFRGLADGEITRYLQFESSLAVLNEDIRKAQEYRVMMEAIQGVTPAMKEQALRQVDGFIEQQKKLIAEREALGWKGHLDRQRFLVSEMLKIKDKYPQKCGPMLEAFARDTGDVKGIFTYRRFESYYRALMDVCVPLKGPR